MEKLQLVRWNIIVTYTQYFYLIIYIIVVVFCTGFYFSTPVYKKADNPIMKVLKLEFSDESKFPKCSLGLEKNGGSITTFFEDFSLPRSQECRFFRELFEKIYLLRVSTSRLQLEPPIEFHNKMKAWLHNKTDLMEQVTAQKIVRIKNRFTGEETLMNSIRDKRPVPESSSAQTFLEKLIKSSKEDCDFCNYERNTATDVFGRLETTLSYTVANAFKLDQYHSMVVFRSHDPVSWNFTQFSDAFHVIEQWFKKVQELDSRCIYRHVYWDVFPKAGGSQVHPHIHMTANSHSFHGNVDNWISAAKQYNEQNSNRNFFEDLVYVHDQLGLTTKLGGAAAIAHINPRKDNELIIVGQEIDADFYKLLFAVVRVYMDDMKVYPYSMVISFPTEESKYYIPVFARVATRGDVSEHRSDVSSLELFSAANVNTDPMNVSRLLQRYVRKFTANLEY